MTCYWPRCLRPGAGCTTDPSGWLCRANTVLSEAANTQINLDENRMVAIITAHQWNYQTKGCACGWSQRQSLPVGMERFNHPKHVVEMLQLNAIEYPGRI